KLLLSSATGAVFPEITDIRGGITFFNSSNGAAVTMYDFNSTVDSQNWKGLLGILYGAPAWGTTPTRQALNFIGNQYMTNTSIIQNACQINAAMIITDGYSDTNSPTVPTYNAGTYGSTTPYQTIYTK